MRTSLPCKAKKTRLCYAAKLRTHLYPVTYLSSAIQEDDCHDNSRLKLPNMHLTPCTTASHSKTDNPSCACTIGCVQGLCMLKNQVMLRRTHRSAAKRSIVSIRHHDSFNYCAAGLLIEMKITWKTHWPSQQSNRGSRSTETKHAQSINAAQKLKLALNISPKFNRHINPKSFRDAPLARFGTTDSTLKNPIFFNSEKNTVKPLHAFLCSNVLKNKLWFVKENNLNCYS